MWRDKILSGYWYQIGGDLPAISRERQIVASTGSGGAIMFGEAMEKQGASDEMIQDSIAVYIEKKWIKIAELTIKKK